MFESLKMFIIISTKQMVPLSDAALRKRESWESNDMLHQIDLVDKERENKIIFKGSAIDMALLKNQILSKWIEISEVSQSSISSLEVDGVNSVSDCFIRNETPVVMMTDASWQNGTAGLAAVKVDLRSGYWAYMMQKSVATSPLEAEVKAIHMALSWAVQCKWDQVCVLSDSITAV
ncbi:hypothetical protein F8388_016526 [Cannabis sativa]|uniref:RNase H type-1 domain-containing protein n=1 Tax=Cannabis sativa TaxID=3483 RepID=A0A7J6E6R6_CANSA|nr:hypothetical protein G4B88_018799 [Cannabis sativa]KAF4363398.1 hypothetical protein F8388_016526 [Cannabis sativa]